MKTLLAALLLLSTAASAHTEAWQRKYLLASRNSGGTYSLPNAPVVTGTTITSSWANTTLADLATEITNSLDRAGRGAMTGPLRLNNAANGAIPDIAWSVEPNTGFWRAGAGDIRFAVGGVDKLFYNSTGAGVGIAPTVPLQIAKGTNLTTIGLFQTATSTDLPVGLLSGTNAAGLDINSVSQTLATASAAGAFAIHLDGANGSTGFYTAPAGAAGAAAGFVEKFRIASTAVIADAPLIIGTSGTAISNSIRGTLVVGGGAVASQTCATQTITVTGAVAGGECSIGTTALNPSGLVSYCQVTTNACQLITCNATAGSLTAAANTLSCRVTNP